MSFEDFLGNIMGIAKADLGLENKKVDLEDFLKTALGLDVEVIECNAGSLKHVIDDILSQDCTEGDSGCKCKENSCDCNGTSMEVENLKRENKRLEELLKNALADLEQYKLELQARDDCDEKLHAEFYALSAKYSALLCTSGEKPDLVDSYEKLKLENSNLKGELEVSNAALTQTQHELKETLAKLSNSRDEVKRLEAECNTLSNDNSMLKITTQALSKLLTEK